jgi:hypothetical protein
MGKIILTGLSFGNHQFTLAYSIVEGKQKCIAYCTCEYIVEIPNFRSYGGLKHLQLKWEEHVSNI